LIVIIAAHFAYHFGARVACFEGCNFLIVQFIYVIVRHCVSPNGMTIRQLAVCDATRVKRPRAIGRTCTLSFMWRVVCGRGLKACVMVGGMSAALV